MSPNIIHVQSILITLSTLILLFNECNGAIFTGTRFTATSNNKYANHTINCDDNQDCIISCEDYTHSCFNSTIHCPSTGNCDIKCKSGPSNNVCENIQITCPTNGNCDISCTSDCACKHASINGNTSNSLTVTCTGNNTCQTTNINAKYTNNFLLECGIGSENTCASLNIHFPPNINNTMTTKKSTIIAGDSFLSINNIPILFYATNGWIDVNIINYIGSYSHQLGTMYCGIQYELFCPFKWNAFECANINDSCNNPFKITQTDVKTVRPISSIKNDNIATDELLYGIVGILLICLCCLGCFCLYFIYHTQSQYIKSPNASNSNSTIANSNNSNNSKTPSTNATNALPPNTANLISVHSISKSSINKLVDSPVTFVSNNSSNKPMMRAYRSYSNRSMNSVNEETLQNIDSATPQPSSPKTPIPEAPVQIEMQLPPKHFLYNIAPITNNNKMEQQEHINIPSTTTSFQPSLSSNDKTINSDQIIYKAPAQHQIIQINAMCNQSAPPSLSEFIKNTNFPVNTNPIPPSNEQSFDTITNQNTMPRYSGTISNTVITNNKYNHKMKPTPTESITLSNAMMNSLQQSLDENDSENDSESMPIV